MLWLLLFASFTASAQCCYNPEPVDLFETPHKKYNFEFEFNSGIMQHDGIIKIIEYNKD